MSHAKAVVVAIATASALVTFDGSASAQSSAEPFYAGKQIKLITHVGPVSGYFVWARLIGNHLKRHIPGSPSLIVQNMPGSGGLKATNYLYSHGVEGRAGDRCRQSVDADPVDHGCRGREIRRAQFGWLGSPTCESNLCVVTKARRCRRR